MGSCICNSICSKEKFSITLEDPSLSTTSQLGKPGPEPIFNLAPNLIQLQDLAVKSDVQIEIQKLACFQRPMLKRSLTVSSPQLPQAEAVLSSCRKVQRAKSNAGKRRNSFLSRAKEKMREIQRAQSKFNEKNEVFSEETTETLSFSGLGCIEELGIYRVRED